MKKIILLLLILAAGQVFAQEADSLTIAQAKKDLTELYAAFKIKSDSLKVEKDTLANMAARLDKEIQMQLDKTRKMNAELDKIFQKQLVFKSYYQSKGVKKEDLDGYFPAQQDYTNLDAPEKNEDEKAIYVLYGDNKIAEEQEVFKDEKSKELFKDIFNINSETCLGTFEIPGYHQKLMLYREKSGSANSGKPAKTTIEDNSNYEPTGTIVLFDHVKFSVREGRIYDIRVRVINETGSQQYFFENRVPISLLNYPQGSRWFYLYNSQNASENVNEVTVDMKEGIIRTSDVLSYLSNPGNNFVPDDVDYTFPTEKEKDTKETRRRVYKVNQNTNLQNVMELRAYTDFLGLFNNSANGIVQVEGKADFFISPFQIKNLKIPYRYANKISPYVHFTRLDKNRKGIDLSPSRDSTANLWIAKPLEIIEKSYLDMGFTIDVLDFTLRKQFPFNINIYAGLRYQIASVLKSDMTRLLTPVTVADTTATVAEDETTVDEAINFKSLGYGGGIRFEFRRFNNFGFFYSPELLYYNHLNRIDKLYNPKNFLVFRNEAEIFYYPNESKKQSIFIRLRTFMNVNDGEDSFFQLQFGYRFSVGLGNVKGKPR